MTWKWDNGFSFNPTCVELLNVVYFKYKKLSQFLSLLLPVPFFVDFVSFYHVSSKFLSLFFSLHCDCLLVGPSLCIYVHVPIHHATLYAFAEALLWVFLTVCGPNFGFGMPVSN